MSWKSVFILGVVAFASAHGHAISEQKIIRHYKPVEHHGHHGELHHIGEHAPEHHEVYADAYPSYEFSYKVEDPHTHDYKGQEEKRDGDLVKGSYWLIQPDGVKRTVHYESDKHSGFKAIVHYEPLHELKHEPIHHEPIHREPKIHFLQEIKHEEPKHYEVPISHQEHIHKHQEEHKLEHLPILKYYQEPLKYEHHELPLSKYEPRIMENYERIPYNEHLYSHEPIHHHEPILHHQPIHHIEKPHHQEPVWEHRRYYRKTEQKS